MENLQLKARQIADSRGRPTVEVVAKLGKLEATGDVPAGASKGEDEAKTVGIDEAVRNVDTVIMPLLNEAKLDWTQHSELRRAEKLLVERAGDNFKELGANAVLPVSRALWQLAAKLHGQQLFAYIRDHEPEAAGTGRVRFFMNIFNGGLHALKKGEQLGRDRIDVQEIMVVPEGANSYRQALEMGDQIDQALKKILVARFGSERVSRADEAGFSVKGLGDSSEAFGYVLEAVQKAGYTPGKDAKLALDVAASSFYDAAQGIYHFQGKAAHSDDMIAYLATLLDRHPGMLLSIEDGLAENDWHGWSRLSALMRERSVITIGDDLFVTQMPRLGKGIALKAAHAILIKVNQNGTVGGTLDVIKHARKNGMHCVVSHRSGETLDDSIADLAYATGALGLKTGDPQPPVDFPDRAGWVRRRKYLRMVEIEESAR